MVEGWLEAADQGDVAGRRARKCGTRLARDSGDQLTFALDEIEEGGLCPTRMAAYWYVGAASAEQHVYNHASSSTHSRGIK